MRDFIERHSQPVTLVRSTRADEFASLLRIAGGQLDAEPPGGWRVRGPDAAAIGALAARHGIPLTELTPRHPSLEEVFSRLTQSSVEYGANTADVTR